MSRTAVTASWQSLGTPTVDTLLSIEGGSVRLYFGDTTGVSTADGHLARAGDAIVVPTGVEMNVVSYDGASAAVIVTDFGT